MWPDRVLNQPLALESDALPTALRGPAVWGLKCTDTLPFSPRMTNGLFDLALWTRPFPIKQGVRFTLFLLTFCKIQYLWQTV